MSIEESILNISANLNLALIDLFILELILMFFFHIDKAGNIKLTVDWLFGISKSKVTEIFVFPFILAGLTYFFLVNFFQDKIILFFIEYFRYALIPLFFGLLSFVIFFVSSVIVGREWKFRLCRPYFFTSIGFFIIVIIWLVIKYK